MNFNIVINIISRLNDTRRKLNRLLDIEGKTIERDFYFVDIENIRLEFPKSEVNQILNEKKKSLENEIRTLAKELLDEVNND